MRLKRSSVPAGFPSASASSAEDNPEEKGKHFVTMAVQTLQDLYKRLVQKLDWANLTSTTKRNLKIAGIVLLGLLVVLVALPFLINVNRFRPKIEPEVTNALGRPVTLGTPSAPPSTYTFKLSRNWPRRQIMSAELAGRLSKLAFLPVARVGTSPIS